MMMSGQKQEETNYKDGNLEGKQTKWHKDGQKRSETNWKDDELID